MKIKEVCRLTGLTEKAVRYYVSNGLCSPGEYESRGRTYLNFTDKNVSELRDVAALRKLGLPVEDIRRMKEDGGSIDRVMRGYVLALSEELEMKNRIFQALAFRDYSAVGSLEELMPGLREALRPDPDFGSLELGPFDDGDVPGEGPAFGIFVRLQEMFISFSAAFGTLMGMTTLPGALLFLVTALVCPMVRNDYVKLYRVLTGVGLAANGLAFLRSAESIGRFVPLSEMMSGSLLGYAAVQCLVYLIAACAELVSLLLLFLGRGIKDYFQYQKP